MAKDITASYSQKMTQDASGDNNQNHPNAPKEYPMPPQPRFGSNLNGDRDAQQYHREYLPKAKRHR
jgi:hypothetical protein